jgi:UDP-N-acetylmuramate dehydrogenase
MSDSVAAALARLGSIAGEVLPGAAIGPWTSYRLGGPADVRVELDDPHDLATLSLAASESGLPILILGRGSNLLVSDDGFRGIAVRLGDGFRWAEVDHETRSIRAGAGIALPTLAQHAADAGLAGLAFASAIPASLGGAIRMNAGAHGSEIGDVVAEIDCWRLEAARAERFSGGDAGFAYRVSHLPGDAVIVSATMALRTEDTELIRGEMEAARAWRRRTQPLNLPNGGSVFKNPPGDHAARLIEEHVGKGTSVGAARISEVHANFIVASSGARARDVADLIALARRRVADATGIELDTEIKLIGFQEDG